MLERHTELDAASLGHLSGELEDLLVRQARTYRRLEMDDLAVAAVARLLVVGENPAGAALSSVLASLRESAPSLIILSVGPSSQRLLDAGIVDGAFAWPRDREPLLQEIDIALAGPLPAVSTSPDTGHWRHWALPASGLGVLLLWQLVDRLQLLPSYILPGPTAVGRAFLSDPERYLGHALVTAGESAAGFFLANTAAMATAIILHRSRYLRDFSLPVLTGLQALPIIALAPLLVVWLGTGLGSKVAMAAIVAYFPLLSNLLAAFVAVDRDLVELFAFNRASYRQTLQRLLLPASYPAIIAALRTSGGLAVVGAIVAEFTGADRGLGFLLLNATYRLETAQIFVAILLSAALGVIFASAPKLLGLTAVGRAYRADLHRRRL